jgi:hypothetical protein
MAEKRLERRRKIKKKRWRDSERELEELRRERERERERERVGALEVELVFAMVEANFRGRMAANEREKSQQKED